MLFYFFSHLKSLKINSKAYFFDRKAEAMLSYCKGTKKKEDRTKSRGKEERVVVKAVKGDGIQGLIALFRKNRNLPPRRS